MTIQNQATLLQPGTIVELYILDLSPNGGPVYRWHNSTQSGSNIINFQSVPYYPYPIKCEGFEWNTKSVLPRPKLAASNVTGLVSGLLRSYGDFIGCTVTRKRTFAQYLDDGINPDALAEYPPDVYTIDRRSVENNSYVEWELSTKMDVEGVLLPRRQIIANACQWIYRGPECGYAGPPVANQFGIPIGPVGADGQCTIGSTTFVATGGNLTGYVGRMILSPGKLADLSVVVSAGVPNVHTCILSKPALANGVNIPFTVAGAVPTPVPYVPGAFYMAFDAVYTLLNGIQQHYMSISTSLSNAPPTDVTKWVADQCAKDLRACKMRFGVNGVLPTGAFPGSSRIPK